MDCTVRAVALITFCIAIEGCAVNPAVKAFHEGDHELATATVKEMSRSAAIDWVEYNNALKMWNNYRLLKSRVAQIQKTRPDSSNSRAVYGYYKEYEKGYFSSGTFRYKLPAELLPILDGQKAEARKLCKDIMVKEDMRAKEHKEKIRAARLAEEKAREERLAKRKTEQEAAKQVELQKAEAKREEHARQLQAEKARYLELGYEGFVSSSVPSFLYNAQQDANLGGYIGVVVGSIEADLETNDRGNRSAVLGQHLEGYSLYECAVTSSRPRIAFFVENRRGKIYQEGQRLLNGPLVFTGMKTFTTVMNAKRTLPVFSAVRDN